MDTKTKDLDDLRPVIHQHVAMLTSAGISPVKALAIAAHTAALVYSDKCEDAMKLAYSLIDPPLQQAKDTNATAKTLI